MKAPILRHETEAFTIYEILDINLGFKWCRSENYELVTGSRGVRETIIDRTRNKYHAPVHAIANVSTGDGGVLVELFWLEATE